MLAPHMSAEPTRPSWWRTLACPDCKQSFADAGEYLSCPACATTFPVRRGVAWLLPTEEDARQELDSTDGAAMVRGYRRPNRLVAAVRRIVTSEFAPGRAWRQARARVCRVEGPLLLLGSGVSSLPGAIHLDLDDFPGVNVVGDAHQLPFASESLAGVVCEVVLEHVVEPQRVVAETLRVLAPGGRCFFIVPFLFPYHGHPGDYSRWTREGLRGEFAGFRDVDAGIHAGPCSAMANLLSEWAYVLSGLRFPRGYVAIKGVATALLFPLKFADLLVNRFPEAHRLASTLYVAATKP
jgi:SAM-dependent methyltransferase